MSDDHRMLEDELQEKGEAKEVPQDQGAHGDGDSLAMRLQSLTVEYARERAMLAEQVSQLQEENDRLRQRVKALEQAAKPQQACVKALPSDYRHLPSECALGLDFSLPEEGGSS